MANGQRLFHRQQARRHEKIIFGGKKTRERSRTREKFTAALEEFVSLGHARKLTAEEAASGTPGRILHLHPVTNPTGAEQARKMSSSF